MQLQGARRVHRRDGPSTASAMGPRLFCPDASITQCRDSRMVPMPMVDDMVRHFGFAAKKARVVGQRLRRQRFLMASRRSQRRGRLVEPMWPDVPMRAIDIDAAGRGNLSLIIFALGGNVFASPSGSSRSLMVM